MSNVSKLVIKACSDNKFSSFTGEFITSINPENLAITSKVFYDVAKPIANPQVAYRGPSPKQLSFSLLFDNTGIIPGSNAIAVMEQIKQLQDVAYNVHKTNNAPNYIRIIWGQIDFKGRLVDLDIVYSMFQVDGTLVRAEARIVVLEEVVSLGKGKSAAGVDSNYTKASGAHATSMQKSQAGQISSTKGDDLSPSQESFAPTPDGMNGPYSGAPAGAYDGSPDQVYHGSNDVGPVYASSSVGKADPTKPTSSLDATSPTASSTSAAGSASSTAMDHADNSSKGGVAGNGPGGSGGGIGGGGHEPGTGPAKSGSNTAASKSPTSASKARPAGGTAKGAGSASKMGKAAAAGAGIAGGAVMAATVAGANSLRSLKEKATGLNFLRRIKNFVKKVAPRVYDAGKKVGGHLKG
ncbi:MULTISPECIES: hypothetical protein [unclassified Candidatus Cardinium]|uniref:CIS tube protein n=1 Tax=unclassified Candidatus Cardinium TaxID=2641185 RepID=UPI001FB4EDD9|nr:MULTISPECIES: hypothetical protein [unclassified Candidatus Cardinium]